MYQVVSFRLLYKEVFIILLFFIFCISGYSQETQNINPEKGEEFGKYVAKEWSLHFNMNTSGAALGFDWGKVKTIYHKYGFELFFDYNRHHKEVLGKNTGYTGATRYAYGKLNTLFFLKGGFNWERTIHQKPYWGGVSIRFRLATGFTLGIAVPTYLRVVYYPDGSLYGYEDIQRYDPEVHQIEDIIGRAPFWKGFSKMTLHPGGYLRLSMNFDFSKNANFMHAIEVGGTIDAVFPGIRQMAYSKKKNVFIGLYLSYRFGKKLGVYEK